jgi:hypothetical protein
MPKKATQTRRRATPRKKAMAHSQNGEGFKEILSSINKFLKKSKIISTLGPLASAIPGVGAFAAPLAGLAGSMGYGKKRKGPKKKKAVKGRGLGLVGSGLRLAGQRVPHR